MLYISPIDPIVTVSSRLIRRPFPLKFIFIDIVTHFLLIIGYDFDACPAVHGMENPSY